MINLQGSESNQQAKDTDGRDHDLFLRGCKHREKLLVKNSFY